MVSNFRYRIDIQVLRGVAVIGVVLFHFDEVFFPNGYLGVDVFFVISGFVVTPLIFRIFEETSFSWSQRNLNLIEFYKRRFFRLAPGQASIFACSAVLILLFGETSEHSRIALQGIASIFLLGNIGAYKYSGDYFSPNPNPLVHTWSLSVEEQIYLFLPIILLISISGRRRSARTPEWVVLLLFLVSFYLFIFPETLESTYESIGIQSPFQFYFYSPLNRIWQFTLGGIAWLYLIRFKRESLRLPRKINVIIVVSLLFLVMLPLQVANSLGTILVSTITVISIVFKSIEILPKDLLRGIAWIGDRSYSIYLIHMPLLYLAKFSPALEIQGLDERLPQSSLSILATIFLGALNYRLIENRFRVRTVQIRKSQRVTPIVFFTIIVPIILFLGLHFGSRNGYWGLDQNLNKPAYAGNMDRKCLRDSEIGPPCSYLIKGSTKSALLIGDSHAGHISQAVIDAANSKGWNIYVWTHSACPIVFNQGSERKVSTSCLAVNKQMKEWLKRFSPNQVIISQYIKNDDLLAQLKNAIFEIKSIVPQVVIIENTPIFPDGKDFMVSRPIIMRAYVPPKFFKLSEMETKDIVASENLAKWARSQGVITLNLNSIFCNQYSCNRYKHGSWLFRDNSHLSVDGASLTIPLLKEYFD